MAYGGADCEDPSVFALLEDSLCIPAVLNGYAGNFREKYIPGKNLGRH